MKNILVINSSARYADSISRDLVEQLKTRITSSEDKIVTRDLNKDIHFVSEQSLGAVGTAEKDRTPEQQQFASLADELIAELQAADTIVIGAPIYNFGAPANLKAWADLVARAGTTFTYSDNGPVGLLENKKAYLVAVSGGTPVEGEVDFMTPWIKFFLGFIGITDVSVIAADGIMGEGGEQKIAAAKSTIENIAA